MRALLEKTLLILALASLSGCATGNVGEAIEATALAVGVSAVRRASGDCYTPCTPGTVCNPSTGYCETLPCRGECEPWERCETGLVVDRCVEDPDARITADPLAIPPQPEPAAQ